MKLLKPTVAIKNIFATVSFVVPDTQCTDTGAISF
jgi:hypothetical protein